MITFVKSAIALGLLALISVPTMASTVTANTGWFADTLSAGGTPTDGSPFTFSLTAGQNASFKVTDQFIVGDSYQLLSGTTILKASTAYTGVANVIIGDAFGESGWLDAAYEKFDYTFSGAGDYSFIITGNGAGGVPAGLFARLDVTDIAVPEPASLALLALGLMFVSATRRGIRHRATA